MKKLTYKKAGVDVAKAAKFVAQIKPLIMRTRAKDLGGFGGLYPFSARKYKNPVLVSSADGVGTKLKIAFLLNKHDTVGVDLVAMNVNDVLAAGAEPLFFSDYIACGKLKPRVLTEAVKGVVSGCRQAGCALVGGETAEMPGFYKPGEYDMAGFCVGVAERNKIIDGRDVQPGDIAIGLASSGLHSNGFSLVRRVLSKSELKKLGRTLLTPTRIYVKPVSALRKKFRIKAIAHITGGAFYEKLPRVLPKNVSLRLDRRAWRVPAIFRLIQREGGIAEKEMYRTFNMGVGMVVIVARRDAGRVVRELSRLKVKSWIIGEAVRGKRKVILE